MRILLRRTHIIIAELLLIFATMGMSCERKEADILPTQEVTAIDSSYFETKEMTEEVRLKEQETTQALEEVQQAALPNEEKRALTERQQVALSFMYRQNNLWPQYAINYYYRTVAMIQREEFHRVVTTVDRIQDTLKHTLPPTEMSYLIIKYAYAVSLYELGLNSRATVAFDDFFDGIGELEASGQSLPIGLLGISYLGAANLAALEKNNHKADSLLIVLEEKVSQPVYAESLSPTDQTKTEYAILDVRAIIAKNNQNWEEAGSIYNEVIRLLDSPAFMSDRVSISDKSRAWYNLGEIYEKQGNIEEALRAYTLSLSTQNTVMQSPFQFSSIYSAITRVLAKSGNTNRLDQSLAASFQYLTSNPEPVTFLKPPKLEELYIGIESYTVIFSATRSVQLLLSQGKLSSHSQDSLKALQGYCFLAVDMIDSLRRQTYTKLEDSRLLADSSMQIYELAIDVTLALAEKDLIARSKNEKVDLTMLPHAVDLEAREQVFALVDQSRGNWLISSIANNTIAESSLMDSTIASEISRLGYLAQRSAEQEVRNRFYLADTDEGESLHEPTTDYRASLDSAVQALKVYHPDYFALKYSPPQASVERVQQELLGEQEAWLEYFVGEKNITCFLITRDTFQMFRTPRLQEMETWIKAVKLRQTYSSVPNESANIPYEIAAYQLYETLLAEPLNLLNETGDKWYVTIVPHESLINLNFGVLLTAPITPDIEQSYHQWPFLERNSNLILSYEISATMGLTQFAFSEKKGAGSVWFGTDDKDMSEIDKTTDDMASRYGGDYFQADESSFKQVAGEYDLIHIGGHGAGNEQAAAEPQVFLSKEASDTEDNHLTLSELYQLNLHASLAVILSCESALGEGHETEGSLSIARGFRYAGVPTTVVSQGKIPVANSASIAAAMYQNLEKGMRVDEALHLAKIAYLESHENDLAAPDLWAGLVVQGKSSTILPLESVLPWWIWLGFIALVGILSIGLITRRARMSRRS